MSNFENLFPENLYHSYIVEGDPHPTALLLRQYLEERGEIDLKSPDLLLEVYEAMTISESRAIRVWHSQNGIGDKKKICIIGTKFINREAERALLKVLEEPAANTHFFLVVPNASLLLDTIRSRTHIIKISAGENDINKNKAREFIESKPLRRIEIIAQMVKDSKDEEGSGGLRYNATNLINEIEKIIYQNFKKEKGGNGSVFILEELQKSRGYLSTPGSAVKMVLEHLALVI